MKQLHWTKHAITRAQQRGFSKEQAQSLIDLADLRTPVADDGAIVTLAHLCGRKASAYTRRDRRAYWK